MEVSGRTVTCVVTPSLTPLDGPWRRFQRRAGASPRMRINEFATGWCVNLGNGVAYLVMGATATRAGDGDGCPARQGAPVCSIARRGRHVPGVDVQREGDGRGRVYVAVGAPAMRTTPRKGPKFNHVTSPLPSPVSPHGTDTDDLWTQRAGPHPGRPEVPTSILPSRWMSGRFIHNTSV